MSHLTLIRIRFSKQANDGNYGSETAACELELVPDGDDEVLETSAAHALLATARHIVHEELSKSPNFSVRRAVEGPDKQPATSVRPKSLRQIDDDDPEDLPQ